MQLCRFCLDDDVPLTGFFADDCVIPIDQAAEVYCETTELELLMTSTEDLRHLLPPRGASYLAARELARWLDAQDQDTRDALSVPIEDVRILPPIERPGKILLLAGNYADHVAEQGDIAAERSETFPYVFMKPATTIAATGDPIILPRVSPDAMDWEVELGVVIGARCKGVSEAEALRYVAGYTVVNDISDRGFRPNPGRSKRDRDRFFDWLHASGTMVRARPARASGPATACLTRNRSPSGCASTTR